MQYICSATMKWNRNTILFFTVINIVLNTLFMKYALINMPILIALTVLVLSSRKVHDLLLFFPAFAIYFVFTIIPESIIKQLFPRFNSHILVNGEPLSLVSVAIDIFLLSSLILLGHTLQKYETTVHLSTKEILGCIGLFFFSFIDVGLLMAVEKSSMIPAFYYLWKFIFVAAFVLSLGGYLYSLIETRKRIYRQALSYNETEYLRLQLDSLQDIKENEEQIKHLRHDLNNHLIMIQSLCEEGNYEEVQKYTKHLRNDIVLAGSNVLTGNKVADLIVRSKLKEATEHDIEFTFSGSLEGLSTMEAPDICGLLANAYDNAIEACLTQQNPYIHTKVSTTRNYTVIQITNSIPHKISIRHNRIATTKQKDSHGYGIEIMNKIAHKYNGSCTLHSSEKELTVKIVLLT